MPLPKQRVSRRRRDYRRSHHAVAAPNLSACPQCRHPRPSHQVCPNCGYYKGREIITTE